MSSPKNKPQKKVVTVKFSEIVTRRYGTDQYFVGWVVPVFTKKFLKAMGVFGKEVKPPTGKAYYFDKAWKFRWKKGSMEKLVAMGLCVGALPSVNKKSGK